MMSSGSSGQIDICLVCGKPWNKHSQVEQDRCYRVLHKKDSGTGIY